MSFIKRTAAVTAAAAVLLCSCGKSDNDGGSGSDSGDKTLAKQLSDNLDAGLYDLTMTVSGDGYETPMTCRMACNGSDGIVTMDIDGVYTEFYTVDSKTYMLMPAIKCFEETDNDGAFGNAFIKLGEGDTLFSEETKDGVVTEIYGNSGDSESIGDKYTFRFDEKTGQLISYLSETDAGTTETDIRSIKWECEDIKLPDLEGWSDISSDATIDDLTQIKFSLYLMGIDEEKLAAEGYTYEQLTELEEDELNALLDKLTGKESEAEE